MAPRIACPLTLLLQSEFGEPMVRINTDPIDSAAFDWNEAAAWDAEAEFYKTGARI